MKFKPGKIVSVEVSSLGDESDAEERKELILTMDRDGAVLTMVRNIACGRKPTQSCRKVPWFWADELCRHMLGCMVEPHAISCDATEGSVISITFGEGKATSVFSWSPPVPEGWEALESIYHEMKIGGRKQQNPRHNPDTQGGFLDRRILRTLFKEQNHGNEGRSPQNVTGKIE